LAAPDYCIRGALQKSAGARTASSSRRTTAAGARPIGKQQRAPRRHGACPASSAASLSRTTRRLEQSSAPATPRCRSRPEGEAPLRRDRWLHEFCNQRPQPRRPTRPRLPVRPGDAALWRRRPDGPSYTVSHELLSSKHKSSSLAGIARTAGPGQKELRKRPQPDTSASTTAGLEQPCTTVALVAATTFAVPSVRRAFPTGRDHSWSAAIDRRWRAGGLVSRPVRVPGRSERCSSALQADPWLRRPRSVATRSTSACQRVERRRCAPGPLAEQAPCRC
jgi:hypothetical protein